VSSLGQSAEQLIDKLMLSLRLARTTSGIDPEALSIVSSCENLLDDIRADLASIKQSKL